LGEPKYKKGFVDEIILDNGKVIIGLDGGLCQVVNLLYWLFLHSPLKVKEHHHLDIFPDSGRVLPFGNGAGGLYNYGDLQFYNDTNYTFVLKTWIDENYLHEEVYSLNVEYLFVYKIFEREYLFYKIEDLIYRKNKIFRIKRQKQGGKLLNKELITINDSKVLYQLTYIKIVELNSFYKDKESYSKLKILILTRFYKMPNVVIEYILMT
jgi:vancomycin resistance protein VanW